MSRLETSMFPLFAANFFHRDEDVPVIDAAHPPLPVQAASPTGRDGSNQSGKGGNLRLLDLQTLPRDDGPPTELRTRKEKLAHYELQCSHVGDCLYVGGEVVAKSRSILLGQRITHVINCVGFLYPPYFEEDFSYQTLYLQGEKGQCWIMHLHTLSIKCRLFSSCITSTYFMEFPVTSLWHDADTPGEDILSVLYDVFDFIEAARTGRIFIHCSQGVSRSTTLAIAYRMWHEGRSYEDVFAEVKQMRGVANPNIGFICQLLQWHKRCTEEAHVPRMYRIAPQSPSAPQYLVPKVAAATPSALDPRGSFVFHSGSDVVIWVGEDCPEAFATAARRVADQLHRYERATATAEVITQGSEPEAFWQALLQSAGTHACTPTAAPSNADPKKVVEEGPVPIPSYDRDYDLYSRALNPAGSFGPADSCDSARSGRKTPREPQPEFAASPNDRLRKQARSEAIERERERTARSSGTGSSYSLGTESARARALDFQELAVRRRAPSPPVLRSPPESGAARPPPPGIPKLSLPGALGAGPSSAKTAEDKIVSSDSDPSDDDDDDPTTSDTDGDLVTPSDSEDEDDGAAAAAAEKEEGEEEAKRPTGVPRLNLR